MTREDAQRRPRRRSHRRGGAALLLAGLLASSGPADAETAAFTAADRGRLDRLCRATGTAPPSPAALAVAGTAVREHEAFGGHVIAPGGALVRFGAVEADATRDEAAGRGAPWRQVMRYWETLGPLGDGPLQVRRFPRLAEDATAPGTGELVPLAEILARLRGTSLPEAEREALAQAAFRAAASDIPWSAAFVSHVVVTAGVSRLRFQAAMAHLDYVAEAARRSRDEAQGLSAGAFYRACDPRLTPLRPGDLLCLHRHDGPGDFAGLVPALAAGERPVWNLHCDVVVATDARRRLATLVGGNVLQSVARRELKTDRRGILARPRRGGACPAEGRIGPLCHPEAAPWFVVLQATDPVDP
ncbi:DUF2272 domain-containing protein [Phreatobacter cathodiphilus]|uniref:DUF2272 domain-containing protein n=1 Tax=Phreatobacter cathodiphilus TaxID=1868589 RepID=A0A2S0N7U0_9HYPH|nr:DUF2272 domain-containing protein [Phreatobacter cathodiphilus]AVO44218.1 hypothetical protein C6569_03555 [Phreatobacter cathodiphilus]